MNLAEAADVLGVKDLSTQSPADLQRIYRDRARTAHPDGGGSAEAFNRLRVAYVLALSEAEAAGCPDCNGTGRMKFVGGFSMASYVCETCHGSGKRWPLFAGKK